MLVNKHTAHTMFWITGMYFSKSRILPCTSIQTQHTLWVKKVHLSTNKLYIYCQNVHFSTIQCGHSKHQLSYTLWKKMTAIFPEFLSYIARLHDKEIIETPWSILMIILLYSCWWGRAVTWTSRTRTGTHPSMRRSDTTPCPSSDSYRTCRTSARYKPLPTTAYHSGSSHQHILLILRKKKE